MSADKQTKDLIAHLDNTLSSLLNAGTSMEKVAADCHVSKGEALIDRLMKCDAALKDWQKELKALDWDLATLKKLYSAFKDRQHGSIASVAEGVWSSASAKASEMKAKSEAYSKEFEKQKAILRKIKA